MDTVFNWILTVVSIPSIVVIGIWVGKIGGRVQALQQKSEAFDRTREDVIRILTILEQSKLGEVNDRFTRIESVVKQIAKREGIDF
jgi:response regulator RpfG family c-di-GMP phosphodiesterase